MRQFRGVSSQFFLNTKVQVQDHGDKISPRSALSDKQEKAYNGDNASEEHASESIPSSKPTATKRKMKPLLPKINRMAISPLTQKNYLL